jgi:RNA polymerase sigma-70 factor (subfamily 1)
MHIDDFVHVLRAAQSGSTKAMGGLLEAARGRLHQLASNRIERELRPKDSPSDLVQDTLLEACTCIKKFKGQSQEEFDAWLARMLVRNVSNFRRAYRTSQKRSVKRELRLSSTPNAAHSDPTSGDMGSDERLGRLKFALDHLPSQDRRILAMRFWQKRSFESIGQREHRSAEAARKLCIRALRKLAQELEIGEPE